MTGSQIQLQNRWVEFGIPHKLINSDASVENLPEREILSSPCEPSVRIFFMVFLWIALFTFREWKFEVKQWYNSVPYSNLKNFKFRGIHCCDAKSTVQILLGNCWRNWLYSCHIKHIIFKKTKFCMAHLAKPMIDKQDKFQFSEWFKIWYLENIPV